MSNGSAASASSAERGLLSTELAMLMPVLVVLALASVFAVEVHRHSARARGAADAAARAAAVHRSDSVAVDVDARAAAARVCDGELTAFDVDWQGPSLDSLRPGIAVVRLTCTEKLGGVGSLFGVDRRSVTTVGVAAIEYWRES